MRDGPSFIDNEAGDAESLAWGQGCVSVGNENFRYRAVVVAAPLCPEVLVSDTASRSNNDPGHYS